jgi:geranylgeranyl diphosphate synthase type I
LHEYFRERSASKYKTRESIRYGTSMAILAGDTAASLSNEIILESGFLNSASKAALELNKIYRKVIIGEALDIESELELDFEKKGIVLIHKMKTAPYTFGAPIHIGSILAENELNFKLVKAIAEPLGVAYQIQDDILGMFGDEQKLGKPIGSDLREGKKTLLVLKALEKASVSDKMRLLRTFGNEETDENDVNTARRIIKETGSLDYSRDQVRNLVSKAINHISGLGMASVGEDFLVSLANYIVDREF